MTPTGDTFTKEPTGYIVCNDKPMAFWLPDGMEPEDIGLMDDSDDGVEAGDDDSGLGDDSPDHGPVAGGQPEGQQI